MPRLAVIVLFLTVAVTLTGSIHYFFWARLVRDPALPQPWRTLATLALCLLAISLPATMILGRLVPRLGRALAWPAFIWMGTMLLLLVVLTAGEGVRLLLAVGRWVGGAPPDPERRQLLSRLLGGVAATVAGALVPVALRNGLGAPEQRDVAVHLARLPASLSGTTIVQLSDLHVGPTIGRSFIESIVARVNALAPDIIAITGDLVDGSVAELSHAVAALGELKARHGVFFVTGNHEYYAGADAWIDELRRLGVRVLRNERVSIGGAEASFDLAGIDDYTARGQALGHGADLPTALAGRDPARELVLLAHQPRAFDEAKQHGVGLQLSGHTHGGQIWPWGYFVKLQHRGVVGLLRESDSHLYISQGTGYWGPPMRLGSRGEITRLTLHRASA